MGPAPRRRGEGRGTRATSARVRAARRAGRSPRRRCLRSAGALLRAQSISYKNSDPLMAVRLHGSTWRTKPVRYLDSRNNVGHVGWQHPRVVRAVQIQQAQCNANSRYVHPRPSRRGCWSSSPVGFGTASSSSSTRERGQRPGAAACARPYRTPRRDRGRPRVPWAHGRHVELSRTNTSTRAARTTQRSGFTKTSALTCTAASTVTRPRRGSLRRRCGGGVPKSQRARAEVGSSFLHRIGYVRRRVILPPQGTWKSATPRFALAVEFV